MAKDQLLGFCHCEKNGPALGSDHLKCRGEGLLNEVINGKILEEGRTDSACCFKFPVAQHQLVIFVSTKPLSALGKGGLC